MLHILIALSLLLATSRAAAEPRAGDKSQLLAHALSIGGTLLPFYGGLALALADREDTAAGASDGVGERRRWTGREMLGGSLALAGLSAGPSLGYYYAGRPARATVGALGRAALIVGAALTERAIHGDDDHHPYLTGLAVAGATCWGVLDVLLLHQAIDSSNARRQPGRRSAGARLGISPAFHEFRGLAVYARF